MAGEVKRGPEGGEKSDTPRWLRALGEKKSENFFIIFFIFSTLCIIHKNRIKTEGGGGEGVCISSFGKYPIHLIPLNLKGILS